MTIILGLDLDAAHAKMLAGEWPEPDPALLEEAFDPTLHPRDRLGRFLRLFNTRAMTRSRPYTPGPRDRILPSLGMPDPSAPEHVKWDKDVLNIRSGDDAGKLLKDRFGIKVDKPKAWPGQTKVTGAQEDFWGDAGFWQQVTQATIDAFDHHPALKTGPRPLVRIGPYSAVEYRDPGAFVDDGSNEPRFWGMTGPDTDVDRNPDPEQAVAAPYAGQKTTAIFFGDGPETATDLLKRVDEQGAVSSQSIYGRMTHELGHAVDQASGFAGTGNAGNEVDAFTAAEIGPGVLQPISYYGASNAAEGWAEVYSMLNVPGGLDYWLGKTVPPADEIGISEEDRTAIYNILKDKLVTLREQVNTKAGMALL